MNDIEPRLFLEELLPLRSICITLEFTKATSVNFFHQPRITAFLKTLIGKCDNFSELFTIDTPESGRCQYHKGNQYRFNLIALDNSDTYLDLLLSKLVQLPKTMKKADDKKPFQTNVKLVSIQDAFTGEMVHNIDELSQYGPQQLTEEALLWQAQCNQLTWRWVSPVRLKKSRATPNYQQLKGEFRFCHDEQDLSPELLLTRVYNGLADLIQRRTEQTRPNRGSTPQITQDFSHLFWIDSGYFDDQKNASPTGGASGEHRFSNLNALTTGWWRLLILGQYIGIGQRRSFGFGRYQLFNQQGAFSFRRVLPAHPLIHQIIRSENLKSAYQTVLANQGHKVNTEPVIGETKQNKIYDQPLDNEQVDVILASKVEQLLNDNYQAQTLTGWLMAKPAGGYRALAIPPFWDRVIQRAVAQVLTPALEQVMSPSSYGYRPGRSRFGARDAIQAAIRQGYQWIFESDIEDFFDSVQHSRLATRLRAALGDDPIIPLILAWMAADVNYNGELIQRHGGLPQGSPLSPLLANLVLDDFDSDMQKAGFKLIRFADDFVVMCKSPGQAKKAKRRALSSLQEHGLDLNENKTHIKNVEQGIQYLGFLFVNDMVVDIGGQRGIDKKQIGEVLHPWMTALSDRQHYNVDNATPQSQIEKLASPQQQLQIGDRDRSGSVLCISGDIAVISTYANRCRVSRDDKVIVDQAWRNIQALVLFGNHHITTPALRAAMNENVCVHFADIIGQYQGTAWPGTPTSSSRLWIAQQQVFTNNDHSLTLAKHIVALRIEHMAEVLRNRTETGHKSLRLMLRQLERAKNLNELNGHEGAATARYFKTMTTLLPDEFHFSGRNRRPPKDPFNVLLSLGYSLLYGYTDSIIRVSGLLPWQGFYHQPHGSHRALASDLMEPYRHLVERKALSMVRKNQLKASDFHTEGGCCTMHKAPLRKYMAALTECFEQEIKIPSNKKSQRLTEHLIEQNQNLINLIREKAPDSEYTAAQEPE